MLPHWVGEGDAATSTCSVLQCCNRANVEATEILPAGGVTFLELSYTQFIYID